MSVHLITVSVSLYFGMLHNLIVGCTLSWYFVIYLSCAWVIPPLRHCYICVCINIFVNVICLVTEIFFCTSYYRLLGCSTYWEQCHKYFLCIICYSIVFILVDLHSQNWINTPLFELIVTCIETHIFVTNFSISHILISIIKLLYCFTLIFGQIFTFNILHPNTCIQHNIYTIFEQISSFSCFVFIHTWIQREGGGCYDKCGPIRCYSFLCCAHYGQGKRRIQ